MMDRYGLSESSNAKVLRGVDALYRHTDEEFGYGSLDDAITDRDLNTVSQMLEAFFFSLKRNVANAPIDARWHSAMRFVREISMRLDETVGAERVAGALRAKFDRLERLHTGLVLNASTAAKPIRALPAVVVEDLYDILAPDSRRNPFALPATRWTAFTVFVLLLHQGLRQGEAIILPVSALKAELDPSGAVIQWLDVRESEDAQPDPRYSRPSIKTAQSIRQIPVSAFTASVLKRYRTDWRRRQPHAFLLASKNRRPLSKEGLAWYLCRASDALSRGARQALYARTREDHVAPHALRHTCATVRLRQLLDHGMGLPEASQQLRSFFGWSMDSDMPRHYAKAAFEDRLVRVWGDQFDQRMAVLRAIPD